MLPLKNSSYNKCNQEKVYLVISFFQHLDDGNEILQGQQDSLSSPSLPLLPADLP